MAADKSFTQNYKNSAYNFYRHAPGLAAFDSQWRLSADPSHSYQSRVQHSCTIHRRIISLLGNFCLGQTKFFSLQRCSVALFLLPCKHLKCSCSVLSVPSQKRSRIEGKPFGPPHKRGTGASLFCMVCILTDYFGCECKRSDLVSRVSATNIFSSHFFLKINTLWQQKYVLFSLRYAFLMYEVYIKQELQLFVCFFNCCS